MKTSQLSVLFAVLAIPIDPGLLVKPPLVTQYPLRDLSCLLERQSPSAALLVPYDRYSVAGVLRTLRQNHAAIETFYATNYADYVTEHGPTIVETPVKSSYPGVTDWLKFEVQSAYTGINAGLTDAGTVVASRSRGQRIFGGTWDVQQIRLGNSTGSTAYGFYLEEYHRPGTAAWDLTTLDQIRLLAYPGQNVEIEVKLVPKRCFPGMLEVSYAWRLNSGRFAGPWTSFTQSDTTLRTDCMILQLLTAARSQRAFLWRKMFDLSGLEGIRIKGSDIFYEGTYACPTPFGY